MMQRRCRSPPAPQARSAHWDWPPRPPTSTPGQQPRACTATRTHMRRKKQRAQPSLGDVTAAVSGGADAPRISAPHLPPAPQLPGVPVGITPTSGHEIATVIHSGPGPQGVLAVAGLLEGAAKDLD